MTVGAMIDRPPCQHGVNDVPRCGRPRLALNAQTDRRAHRVGTSSSLATTSPRPLNKKLWFSTPFPQGTSQGRCRSQALGELKVLDRTYVWLIPHYLGKGGEAPEEAQT